MASASAAASKLTDEQRDVADLEVTASEAAWIVGALRDFAKVWSLMTPKNQERLLRALVAVVRENEASGVVELEFVFFVTEHAKEAA